MEELINSHIQLPKLLLKRFEEEENGHYLYYIDIRDRLKIKRSHAKSLNTELGYYSKDMEAFLEREVETPFSKILKYIEKIDFDKDTFWLGEDFETTVKDFCIALFARGPQMMDSINHRSVYYQFMPSQSQHDYAVYSGICLGIKANIFDGYYVTFAINKSTLPFVLPMCGEYGFNYKGCNHIVLPISPKIALLMVEKKRDYLYSSEGLYRMLLIDDDAVLNNLNLRAFQSQAEQKYGYVVANKRYILENMLST